VFDHASNLPWERLLVILDGECLFRLRTHEQTHLNMPLMVPTRLLGNDLRHQLDGSDMVGPAPPRIDRVLPSYWRHPSYSSNQLHFSDRDADHRANQAMVDRGIRIRGKTSAQ
jgi:hypothetical protein